MHKKACLTLFILKKSPKSKKNRKKLLTNKDESVKITRSPQNDDKSHFQTESKKFEKVFKKVLTKEFDGDIIDKLTQKG